MKRIMFLSFMVLQAASLIADSAHPTQQQLQDELGSARAKLQKIEKELAARNEALRTTQHDLEYKNPEIVALREQLIAVEKQALALREQIQARLALDPEIKRIEAERKELFQSVQRLRDEEAAIQREIKALEMKTE